MKQRALIPIDMLLDTRYGTLRLISEEIADELVRSDHYRNRVTDNFGEMSGGRIDQKQYEELYAKRDGDTLFMSRFTDFVYVLRKDIKEGVEKLDRGIWVDAITVDINLHPYYDLSDAEAEVIRRSVAHYLPPACEVKCVTLPPEILTPQYIENFYELFAFYNYEDWLGPNQEALLKHRIPLHVLLTPMLSTTGVEPETSTEFRDPFKLREAALHKFIALHHIAMSTCSHNIFIPLTIYSSRSKESAPPEHLLPGQV